MPYQPPPPPPPDDPPLLDPPPPPLEPPELGALTPAAIPAAAAAHVAPPPAPPDRPPAAPVHESALDDELDDEPELEEVDGYLSQSVEDEARPFRVDHTSTCFSRPNASSHGYQLSRSEGFGLSNSSAK